MKLFSIAAHALKMVKRKLKNYALLSVTIIISFSLLLAYMTYTDTVIYNEYKELFSNRRGDMYLHGSAKDIEKITLLQENLSQQKGVVSFCYYHFLVGSLRIDYTVDGQKAENGQYYMLGNWQLLAVPDYAWLDDTWLIVGENVTFLDGRENFVLAQDECIMNEQLYYALELDQQEEPHYTFRFREGISLTLRIAGVLKEKGDLKLDKVTGNQDFSSGYHNMLLVSTELMQDKWMDSFAYIGLVIHSEQPEQTASFLRQLNYDVEAVYEYQDEALEIIRTEKQTKAIISCALLVLLGINLYSCFSNALADRRYEIGVKRALGASGWSIVRQFLYESLIVMVANTLVSVSLVADIAAIYKYVVEHTPMEDGSYQEFILYISPYSLAMFGVCAITLTVVFSLIFAFQATRVEIIKHLKAE